MWDNIILNTNTTNRVNRKKSFSRDKKREKRYFYKENEKLGDSVCMEG